MSTNTVMQSTVPMPVPAHDHATCLHDLQLYSDDAYLLDSLTTFVGREIAKGNSAIVIATKEHRDGLAERLAGQYPDLCLAVEQGRYIALDAADTLSKFMVNGAPDPVLFSEVVGPTVSRAAAAVRGEHSRVAAYGEMVSLLWDEGQYEAVVRLEQLWNDLGKTHSFALRCGYPLKGFDRKDHSDMFLKICAEHSDVIPDESFTKLPDEKERLRSVASLQQREQALATEVAEFRAMSAQTVEIQNRNVELIEEVKKRETAEDELRRFTRRLLASRDTEQRRVARELHENAAQLLAALAMSLSVLHEEKDALSPRGADAVLRSTSLTQNVLQEVRKLSHVLHPPTLDEMGLAAALRWYVEQFEESSGIKAALDLPKTVGRLPKNLEIAAFRIVEEALKNVLRHSRSSSVAVRMIRSKGELLLEVQDEGVGMPSQRETTGLGIVGMRERATELGGSLTINSSGRGTLISAHFPLAQPNR
jgi:signal transduction histidine kinase